MCCSRKNRPFNDESSSRAQIANTMHLKTHRVLVLVDPRSACHILRTEKLPRRRRAAPTVVSTPVLSIGEFRICVPHLSTQRVLLLKHVFDKLQ